MFKNGKVECIFKVLPQKENLPGFTCWEKLPKDIMRKGKHVYRVDEVAELLTSMYQMY